MNKSFVFLLFILFSCIGLKNGWSQIEKRNHIIVLIDNSGDMDTPFRGGFSRNQLRSLMSNELPQILFDNDNPYKSGTKLLGDKDYLTVYFCGVDNQTQPDEFNFFSKVIDFEFSITNKEQLTKELSNLDITNFFNRDFGGMTLSKQLAINRLGNIRSKPRDVGNTYFLVLTDGQLNSRDITTELVNSPFHPTNKRPEIRKIYEKVEYAYNMPVSKFIPVETVPLMDGSRKGWSILKITPRVVLADFNVRSLLLDLNSNVILERTDNWNYKGKYSAKINPEKESKYEIKNVSWKLFDKKNKIIIKQGNINQFDNGINIDLDLKNPEREKNNYQLQLKYDVLLKDIYGCTVVSPQTEKFDRRDNLSMAIDVNLENNAKIFGFYELPATLYYPVIGNQQSNVVFWNLIFSLIVIMIVILILRQVYIYQLSKRTKNVKAKIV